MLTHEELHTLNLALIGLYQADLTLAGYPKAAFRVLHTLVDADQINFAHLDAASGEMDLATSAPSADWARGVEGFGRCMAKYPMSNFDPSVNEGRPFFSSDFVTLRQFRDLDLYQECFRVLGMQHHGAVHVPTEDGRLLWFGVERAGARSFTERDRLMLTLAQPHLANARRLIAARQALTTRASPEHFTHLGFTPREAEVAVWLAEGKSNVEIALLLGRHVQTVKSHVTCLFDKTGTHNRLALTLHLLEIARAAPLSAPLPIHRLRPRSAQSRPRLG